MSRINLQNLLFVVIACLLSARVGATTVKMDIAFGDQPAGSVYVDLLESDAPLTTKNFLNYIENAAGDRRYDGVFIHRSLAGFVVQTGGYVFVPNAGTPPHIVEDKPVKNEFDVSRSNVRGTLAMAKVSGDPDSAKSEWFFNLADNSADLDAQNGGFTVFGRVLGNGMVIVDAIAALDKVNAGGAFTDLPVIDLANAIADSNLVTITQMVVDPPARISAVPLDHDYGFVALSSGATTTEVTIQNIGSGSLSLNTLGDTDPLGQPFSIPPGGDTCSGKTLASTAICTITVEFDPVVPGDFSDSFNLSSSDGTQPDLTVSFSGAGRPDMATLEVTPASLDFGNVGTGEPKTLEVIVHNDGGGQLQPLVPLVSGFDSGVFSISLNQCDGVSLNIGETCSVFIELQSFSIGDVSALLDVSADPGNQSVQLSLGGKVTLLEPRINVPNSLTMDDTRFDQVVTSELVINNAGIGDMYISRTEFVGNDSSLFSIAGACIGIPVAPASSCSELVTFVPNAVGIFGGVIRVTSNSIENPVIDIPLSATASQDNDGVADAIEQLALHNGDGNQDGIQDMLQERVASLRDAGGQFVTLEVPDGMVLSRVATIDNPSPSTVPTTGAGTLEFSHGFFSFTIENVPGGGEAAVTFYLPQGQSANGYFKFGRLPGELPSLFPEHWYDFSYDPQSRTGAEFSGNRVTLSFVDGGRGDNDQQANGRIVDPGGPAVISAGSSPGGGGCSLSSSVAVRHRGMPIDFVLLLTGLIVFRVLWAGRATQG